MVPRSATKDVGKRGVSQRSTCLERPLRRTFKASCSDLPGQTELESVARSFVAGQFPQSACRLSFSGCSPYGALQIEEAGLFESPTGRRAQGSKAWATRLRALLPSLAMELISGSRADLNTSRPEPQRLRLCLNPSARRFALPGVRTPRHPLLLLVPASNADRFIDPAVANALGTAIKSTCFARQRPRLVFGC